MAAGVPTEPQATLGPEERRYPLTPMQFGMAYGAVADHRPGVNLEQIVVHLTNEHVDRDRLRAAFQAVVDRHDVLRTTIDFGADGVEPSQVVHATASLEWVEHMLEAGADVDAELGAVLDRDRRRGLDVTVAAPTRVHLLHVGDGGAVVVWTLHHALVDGRSMRLLLDDVFARYDGVEPPAAPAARFSDHVDAVLAGATEAVDHFSRIVAGAAPTPLAPVARSEVTDANAGGTTEAVIVHRATMSRLESWARARDVTTGAVLLAAWAVLLARHTGRTDVLFGSTRAGRTADQHAAVAGCYITTIPLRIELDPRATVNDLVRLVRHQQLAARPYEHVSLVELARRHHAGAGEYLPTVVMYERGDLSDGVSHRRGPWQRRQVALHERSSVPVLLAAYDTPAGLRLHVDHDPTIHPPRQMADVAAQVATLLTALAEASDDDLVDELPLLPQSQLDRLQARNPPPVPPGAPAAVVDRIDRHAAVTPGSVAVVEVATGSSITYGELVERSRGLAAGIAAAGAVAGEPVAIALGRSIEYVVAMLAILRAGSPFLPLDPTYPASAIEFMLEDAPVAIAVTGRDRAVALPGTVTPIDVDGPDAATATTATFPSPRPDDTAYVIYTSGTTGTPNGVEVTHRALGHYVDAAIARYQLTADDRVLQFASLGFDISLEEILPTLVAGACLVLRSDEMADAFDRFAESVAAAGVTVLNLPTAFWHELVDGLESMRRRMPSCVRLTVVGGERPFRSAAERWSRLAPRSRWLNAYGVTEATITSTVFDPADAALDDGAEVPIGRPIENSRVYVLDDAGRLVPDGVVGTLWIGGSGVAAGYRSRPELTAQRFRPDPFVGAENGPASSMYCTGDLARWSPAGQLEFLGRADRQVKVRGYRVELDGIASAAANHPAVASAVADVRPGEHGGLVIAVWVVPRPGADLTVPAVRSHLARVVPEPALPDRIAIVDRLPATAGGKVDVASLPLPGPAAVPTIGRQRPVGAREREVAEEFASVLQTPVVDVDASFFELGGHSLLALRLVSRLAARYDIDVGVADLHRNPSARRLAAVVDGRLPRVGGRHAYVVTIRPDGTRVPIFAVHMIGINGRTFRPLAARLGGDQPVYAVSVDHETLMASHGVGDLGEVYADAVEATVASGPVVIVGFCVSAAFAFDTAQRLRRRGREVSVLALFDALGPDPDRRRTGRDRIHAHLHGLRRHGARYVRWLVLNRARDRVRDLQVAALRRLRRTIPDELQEHMFGLVSASHVSDASLEPYDAPVVVLSPESQVLYSADFVASGLGWRSVAVGPLELATVAGGHLTMLTEPAVGETAAALERALDRYCGSAPVSPVPS